MGPPPFDGGNCHESSNVAPPSPPLQWGHRLSTVETTPALPGRTNGRALRRMTMIWNLDALLQWGHRLSTVETRFRSRLRAPLRSRLQWGHRLSTVETRYTRRRLGRIRPTASMGPPPFDGGNPEILRGIQRVVRALQWGHRLSTVETGKIQAADITRTCFNGATAFRRWKPDTRGAAWGGYGRPSRWNLVSGTKASMGPPPFDGGNPEILRGIQRVVRALQWGHRLSTVETRFSSSGFSLWATLQWGHRLSTVETLRRMTMIWNLDALLQWGHRLSTVETGRR
jgi:hypothetical protein